MRTRDRFWYTTGVVIGRVVVAGRALAGQVREARTPVDASATAAVRPAGARPDRRKVPVGRGHRI